MAIYSDIHSASAHVAENYIRFNGRPIVRGCANSCIFDSFMRVFDRMNTSDIDCGISFEAVSMVSGVAHLAVITLYKTPDGKPELIERFVH